MSPKENPQWKIDLVTRRIRNDIAGRSKRGDTNVDSSTILRRRPVKAARKI